MTSEEMIDVIVALGISQLETARLLGVDDRTARRWISGERAIPPPAARFLRLMLAAKIDAKHALKLIGTVDATVARDRSKSEK